jgi:two-component system, cell cycle sensor histidine kinase and response regulator CckA
VSVSISPIHDDAGTVIGASAITHDITGRVQAEAARRDLEERSRQAQRLLSLGQLAGGIAHDFNNLLAIILNYSTFITEQSAEGSAVHADAEKIQTAAERGTALTRQLLVFARGEPTHTEVFDLNTVVAKAQNLLEHTIGAHIHVLTRLAPAPVLINADPGQLHQVLLNLAINSRDAMPDGGTL